MRLWWASGRQSPNLFRYRLCVAYQCRCMIHLPWALRAIGKLETQSLEMHQRQLHLWLWEKRIVKKAVKALEALGCLPVRAGRVARAHEAPLANVGHRRGALKAHVRRNLQRYWRPRVSLFQCCTARTSTPPRQVRPWHSPPWRRRLFSRPVGLTSRMSPHQPERPPLHSNSGCRWR